MEVSVVILAYNSSGSLAALVKRLGAVLSLETIAYEVILVNDGKQRRNVVGRAGADRAHWFRSTAY